MGMPVSGNGMISRILASRILTITGGFRQSGPCGNGVNQLSPPDQQIENEPDNRKEQQAKQDKQRKLRASAKTPRIAVPPYTNHDVNNKQ